ncbi:MAG: tol-pal system protein YbgF [Rhodospirillales bacterium]
MNYVEGGQAVQERPAARRCRAMLLGVCLVVLVAAGPARAQGTEPRLLIPGGGGTATQPPATLPPVTVPSSSPALSGAASPVPAATPATARLEVRMSQLEQDLRTVTGRMEDMAFQLRKLDDRLDKLAADMEYRLSQARNGDTTAAVAGSAAVAVGGGAVSAPPQMASAADGDVRPPAAQSGYAAPAASDLGGQQTASLPAKTPREQYARAFAQLERRQYAESAAGFSDFLKANPNDPLADNARYWLAETYYARGEYGRSAELFLDAYEKSKTGPKAPDTLLKLGLSLAGLDKNKEACATFRELGRGFPNAPDAIRERAAQESKRIGC